MGAMKNLMMELDDYLQTSKTDDVDVEDYPALELIMFFNDITAGVEMFKKGVTLKQIKEDYPNMPSAWVYALLKDDK